MKPKLIYQVFVAKINEDGNQYFLWEDCHKQKYSRTDKDNRRIVVQNPQGSFYIVDENGKILYR